MLMSPAVLSACPRKSAALFPAIVRSSIRCDCSCASSAHRMNECAGCNTESARATPRRRRSSSSRWSLVRAALLPFSDGLHSGLRWCRL